MDRLEILNCWNSRDRLALLKNTSRWVNHQVFKYRARWTGKPQNQETMLFWGQPMSIIYPELVSARLGRFGYFEKDMTSMFIDVLRPGMTVYDVGSHFGYFSLLASEIVGERGHVFAFEPTTDTFDVLIQNAKRRTNITCNQLAAHRETGEIFFQHEGLRKSAWNHVVTDQSADHANLVRVAAVKLDEFAAENRYPDFVKIDAEGSEAGILEGMAEIIRRHRPGIGLEMGDHICEQTGNQPCRKTIEFLLDHGYEVFDYRNCQIQPHDVKDHYIYDNLFFRHRQRQVLEHAA